MLFGSDESATTKTSKIIWNWITVLAARDADATILRRGSGSAERFLRNIDTSGVISLEAPTDVLITVTDCKSMGLNNDWRIDWPMVASFPFLCLSSDDLVSVKIDGIRLFTYYEPEPFAINYVAFGTKGNTSVQFWYNCNWNHWWIPIKCSLCNTLTIVCFRLSRESINISIQNKQILCEKIE